MRALPRDAYVPLISGPIQEYVRRWLSGHYERGPGTVKELFAEAAWNAVRGPGVVGGGSARDQGTGRSSTAPEGSNR
jgi:hypothetical protein